MYMFLLARLEMGKLGIWRISNGGCGVVVANVPYGLESV